MKLWQQVTAVWQNGGFSAKFNGSSSIELMYKIEDLCFDFRHFAKLQNVTSNADRTTGKHIMKSIISILAFLILATGITFGQSKFPIDSISKKVVFRQIIQLDSTYKSDKIFSIVKEWFSTNTKNFNRSNSDKNANTGDALFGIQRGNSTQLDQLYKIDQPLKLQDQAEKKIIGKAILKYTGSSMGCLRIIYTEFDIKVLIKDSKLKIEITNFNYTHYNQMTMKQVQIYGWTDDGPCNSKNSIENLLTCTRCSGELEKFYNYLIIDMFKLTGDLQSFINENKKSNSTDGW